MERHETPQPPEELRDARGQAARKTQRHHAPADEPVPEASATPDGTKRHVHHSYIWLAGIRVFIIILFATAVSLFSSVAGVVAEGKTGPEASLVLTVVTVCCVAFIVIVGLLVFLLQWWSYKHLYYVLGPDEFNLYSGIFNKKRVHVPYNKVQSVDQKATLLQRIAGVCTVYVDTAGGASNKAVMVPYLTKHDAEWLRAELFARKSAAVQGHGVRDRASSSPDAAQRADGNILDAGQEAWDQLGGLFAGDAYEDVRVTYEYGLTNKELFLAGLSNRTSFFWILAVIVLFLLQGAGFFFELFPNQSNDVMSGVAQGFGAYVVDAGVGVLVGFAIPAIIVIWAISIAASCINYGGFKACRRGARVEVQHGLLQHSFQGVDIGRVQAVVISQSFIRRLLGYCELSLSKVEAAAQGDESNARNAQAKRGVVIHPFVKLSEVPLILAGMVPEFEDVPTQKRKVAPVALRRAITRRCIVQGLGFWLAVLVALFQLSMWLLGGEQLVRAFLYDGYYVTFDLPDLVNPACMVGYVLAVLITVISLVDAILWARSSSFAFNERFMQVTNGGFSIETVNLPRQKIQYGYTKTNPLQRMAHTATIKVRTAAGIGGTTITLVDATRADAVEWLTWLEPRPSCQRG